MTPRHIRFAVPTQPDDYGILFRKAPRVRQVVKTRRTKSTVSAKNQTASGRPPLTEPNGAHGQRTSGAAGRQLNETQHRREWLHVRTLGRPSDPRERSHGPLVVDRS
jgi:hypothetical protein